VALILRVAEGAVAHGVWLFCLGHALANTGVVAVVLLVSALVVPVGVSTLPLSLVPILREVLLRDPGCVKREDLPLQALRTKLGKVLRSLLLNRLEEDVDVAGPITVLYDFRVVEHCVSVDVSPIDCVVFGTQDGVFWCLIGCVRWD
jgi:hypothetical protein